MKTNREAYISIIKRRDEYLENKKRQNTIIVRSAVIASGVCAAAAIGIGIAVNNEIHNPEADIPTAEIPAVTAVTDAYEPVNTEPFSSAVTEPDSSYETSISAGTEYTETQSTDTQSTFTQSNNKETTTGTEPEKNNNTNETVQSTEKPSGEKTETDKPQSTTDSRPADDRPQSSEPENSEPVVTEPQEQPDIPLTEEEIAMKEKYKKAAAFLTAMASMAGTAGIISSASEVKVTEDDRALVYIDQHTELMDFNGDGEFSVDDFYPAFTYVNERDSLTEGLVKAVEENADVNNDGKIDYSDLSLIAGYHVFNIDSSLVNFSDEEYGSDDNKKECKSFYNNYVFMNYIDKNVASKYNEPQFRRFCVKVESGEINLDINGDGTTDVKDLFDWSLYAEYYDAESDDILVPNPQAVGFTIFKDSVTIPIDAADISRIKEAGKALFQSECPSGGLLEKIEFLKMIGRYVLMNSDVSADQLVAEYYDNIYGIEYSDYYHERFNTPGEVFIMHCLAECIEIYKNTSGGCNEISIRETDDYTFIRYSDHAEVYHYRGSMEKVVIPSEFEGVPVTVICDFAFECHDEMKEVVIPDTVTKIGKTVFYYDDGLESIIIPDSVTTIDQMVFEDCKNLKHVKLSENLDKISFALFRGCTSLESVELPENLTEIGMKAFQECSSLESIKLPEKLTVIGEAAFCDSGLKEITIPANVSQICKQAFTGCDNMTAVNITGENTIIAENALPYHLTAPKPEDETLSDYVNGDIDGSGIVDVTDLSTLSLYIIGDLDLAVDELLRADVDTDGEVLITDLAGLMNVISKIFSGN